MNRQPGRSIVGMALIAAATLSPWAEAPAWGQPQRKAQNLRARAQQRNVPDATRAAKRFRPGIIVEQNLVYAWVGSRPLRLNLYRPEGPVRGVHRPLLVWIHGGGWHEGSYESTPAAGLATRQSGYVVASVEYRLTDEAIFPAQIRDCRAAIRWLRANASRFGIDPNRVGVWGSSAGGHLAALVGTAGNSGIKDRLVALRWPWTNAGRFGVDPNRVSAWGSRADGQLAALIRATGYKAIWDVGWFLNQPARVQAVCDFNGPTDLNAFPVTSIHAQASGMLGRLLGGPLAEQRELARAASPITYVDRNDPPFLIVHGTKDAIVPVEQSDLLVTRLKQAGVPTTYLRIKGLAHSLNGPREPGQPSEEAVYQMVHAFFDNQLKP